MEWSAYGSTAVLMQLLLVTNLYPPQELGGYGRSMADFAWGLMQRGHHLQVICADVPHLGDSSNGPSGEPVSRCLRLKGSFHGGVQLDQNQERCRASDAANQHSIRQWLKQRDWDGVLAGNIDLLGLESLQPLIDAAIPLIHHIGFVTPPFDPKLTPTTSRYQVACASQTVKKISSRLECRSPQHQWCTQAHGWSCTGAESTADLYQRRHPLRSNNPSESALQAFK